jgi:hypothetical protein
MKKQTLVTVLVLALLFSAIDQIQLINIGTAYAKPTVTDISVSNNASVPFSPDLASSGVRATAKLYFPSIEKFLNRVYRLLSCCFCGLTDIEHMVYCWFQAVFL